MRLRYTVPSGAWTKSHRGLLRLSMVAALLALVGCGKNVATEASDSDANGYLCANCGAKFYTDRSIFLAQKCPKCKREGLVEVVGYFCAKDNHLAMVGRGGDRQGAVVCEKCGGPLGGMRLPREKDFQAWGATRVPK